MMKLLATVSATAIAAVSAVSVNAWALPTAPLQRFAKNCGMLRNVDFIPAEEGINQIQLPLQVLAASPALTFDVPATPGQAARCSSSVVSDSGILLTAGHCLDFCMEAHGGIKKIDSGGQVVATTIDQKAVGQFVCSGTLNGEKVDFQILAASHCGVKIDKAETGDCFKQADFALVKPVNTKQALPCLNIEQQDLRSAVGRPIATVGFPGKTERAKILPEARDSDGNAQYLSLGSIVKNSVCSQAIPKFFEGQSSSVDISLGGFEKKRATYLQLSAEIVPGNSGGPVVDQRTGKVIGVANVSGRSDWETAHCAGASFATPISQIQKDLSSTNTEAQINAIFSCKQNAAVK